MYFKHRIPSLDSRLYRRGSVIIKYLQQHISSEFQGTFFIAGGALLKWPPNDIDLYTASCLSHPIINAPVLCETSNVITYAATPYPIQLSLAYLPTLKDLVHSIDLSHLQVGVSVHYTKTSKYIRHAYYTPEYIDWLFSETSVFTGSNKPLASLLRIAKYYKRDEISKADYIKAMLGALAATLQRGVTDVADLKNQICGLSEEIYGSEPQRSIENQLDELAGLLAKHPGSNTPTQQIATSSGDL